MTDRPTPSDKPAAQETREARRAEALRANLRRRKEQARERRDRQPEIHQTAGSTKAKRSNSADG